MSLLVTYFMLLGVYGLFDRLLMWLFVSEISMILVAMFYIFVFDMI